MAKLTLRGASDRTIGWPSAVAALAYLGVVSLHATASAEADVLQQAVNYVFTGTIDPARDGPVIEDRTSCIVVLRDPHFPRYIRYYLSRFKIDDALFDKKYSGSRVAYELNVKGDDVVIEYLDLERKSVIQAYRSAQIALPGDIDETRKALRIVTDRCKAEKPKSPF